jgi:hypothetical protein
VATPGSLIALVAQLDLIRCAVISGVSIRLPLAGRLFVGQRASMGSAVLSCGGMHQAVLGKLDIILTNQTFSYLTTNAWSLFKVLAPADPQTAIVTNI